MLRKLIYILTLCALTILKVNAQKEVLLTDSLYVLPATENSQTKIIINNKSDSAYKPDPVRVLWMGAIIPGYGQILNRSYWKLPIVYAGFLGCTYAISLNSIRYESYKAAYRDISDTNPNTVSYEDLLPPGYTVDNYPGGMAGLKSIITTGYNQYRRYRDLSIIASVAYYGLTLVEAYVDAQLFDFDISNDLSMHIRPSLMTNQYGNTPNSAGIQLSFKIK
ncbi:MAG: hypothetical protein JXR27_09565 [Paludibacteraceae bacterium]|nr:hypothetical protein [Paludibacteraceae bacterium]